MPKYLKMVEGEDGWTDWIAPKMDGYRMACCDCDLIHVLEFRAVRVTGEEVPGEMVRIAALDPEKVGVVFRARRDNRATAQRRRKRKTDATR